MNNDQSSELDFFTDDDFAKRVSASPESMERLRIFDAQLIEANAQFNLVARSTIGHRWWRHYLDSAQLLPLLTGQPKTILDLGSGAGFPGIILAALLADTPVKFTLIESTGKKARFLDEARAAMGLTNVTVVNARAESFVPQTKPDFITARAVAALDKLCAYTASLVGSETVCIFPKGAKAEEELTEARKAWHMDVVQMPSITSADARIFVVRNLRSR